MEFIIFLMGPPILVYVILALLPPGKLVLIGYAVFAVVMIALAFAIYPISSAGPDDWFAGIEEIPYQGSLWAAGVVGIAQLWRAWRF